MLVKYTSMGKRKYLVDTADKTLDAEKNKNK
jgi:hypothetical protein